MVESLPNDLAQTDLTTSPELSPLQLDELWRCVQFAMAIESHRPTTPPQLTTFAPGEFSRALYRHRLDLALNPVISQLTIDSADAEIIKQRARRQQLAAMSLARDTADIVQILDRASIRVIVMKGVALAVQTTGNLASRGPGDVDLWVSPDDLERAVAALENDGVERARGFAPMRFNSLGFRYSKWLLAEMPLSRGALAVDLHWWPLHVRNLLPSFDESWGRRATFELAGVPVNTLGATDALMHSCAHAQQDNWFWLRSLVDIDRLARGAQSTPSTAKVRGLVAPTASVTFAVTRSPYLRYLAGPETRKTRAYVADARRTQRRWSRPDEARWSPSLTWKQMQPRLAQSRGPANVMRVTALSAFPPRSFLDSDGMSDLRTSDALAKRIATIGRRTAGQPYSDPQK